MKRWLATVLIALALTFAPSCTAMERAAEAAKRSGMPVLVATLIGGILVIFVPEVGFFLAIPATAVTATVINDASNNAETRETLADIKKTVKHGATVPWYLNGWEILKALVGWAVLVGCVALLVRKWKRLRPLLSFLTLGLNHVVSWLSGKVAARVARKAVAPRKERRP